MVNIQGATYNEIVRILLNGGQVFYLLGDRGVGKRTIVRDICKRVGSKLVEYDRFHVDEARSLKNDCTRVFDQPRMFLINGDNTNNFALNAILKLLEEPPRRCAFFISASTVVLPTITSRCNMVLFPRLTDQELLDVLAFKGMNANTAKSLLPYAAGSVDGAYEAYRRMEIRKQYLRYFIALQTRDEKFIFDQIKRITRDDVQMLLEICDGLLMSRYGLGTDEVISITPQFIQKVKSALLDGSIPATGLLRAWLATM